MNASPRVATTPHHLQDGPGLLATLMAVTALGQLGVNLALPALPVIGDALGMAEARTGLVLSSCLVGLAGGQLLSGPASDRYGRKPLLLLGLVLFSAACLASALAPDAEWLLALGFALADKGHDLRLIQDYLGHRDPRHTVHYTRTAGPTHGNSLTFRKAYRTRSGELASKVDLFDDEGAR